MNVEAYSEPIFVGGPARRPLEILVVQNLFENESSHETVINLD